MNIPFLHTLFMSLNHTSKNIMRIALKYGKKYHFTRLKNKCRKEKNQNIIYTQNFIAFKTIS